MADGYEKIVLLDKGVAKELNSSEEEVQRHFYKRLWQESEKTLGFSRGMIASFNILFRIFIN